MREQFRRGGIKDSEMNQISSLAFIYFILASQAQAQAQLSNSSSLPSGDIVIDETSTTTGDDTQKVITVACSAVAGIILFLSLKWARIRYLAKLHEEEDRKNGKGETDGLEKVHCDGCDSSIANSMLNDSRIPIQAQLQMLTIRQHQARTAAAVNPIDSETVQEFVPPKKSTPVENL